MRRIFVLFVLFGWVPACGGATPPDFGDASGADGSTTGDGGNNADGSSKEGGGGQCTNGQFPMFEKGCTSSDACIVELHQIDCCGTLDAIGVNHNAKSNFDAAEQMWRAACPKCQCDPGQTRSESGTSCDTSKIAVKCVMGSGMSVGKCTTVCQ